MDDRNVSLRSCSRSFRGFFEYYFYSKARWSPMCACNFPRFSGVVKNNPCALMVVVNSSICQIRNTRAKCPCCYYYYKHIQQTGFCLVCTQHKLDACEIFEKSDTSFSWEVGRARSGLICFWRATMIYRDSFLIGTTDAELNKENEMI